MLAAVSLRTAGDSDVIDLLEQALYEVGLSYYEPRSIAAQESALAVIARRALTGELQPRALAAWTHRVFGHDRLALAERFAELDDVYDAIDYTDLSVLEVDAEVIAEAVRIAAHNRSASG